MQAGQQPTAAAPMVPPFLPTALLAALTHLPAALRMPAVITRCLAAGAATAAWQTWSKMQPPPRQMHMEDWPTACSARYRRALACLLHQLHLLHDMLTMRSRPMRLSPSTAGSTRRRALLPGCRQGSGHRHGRLSSTWRYAGANPGWHGSVVVCSLLLTLLLSARYTAPLYLCPLSFL